MNHEQSRTLEGKLWRLVERKQREMQEGGLSWIEVQFMSTAVRALGNARTTLKYTYVFAYYLQKNNQAEIFLQNQKDLEMAAEKLSGYLEGEASGAQLGVMRQTVMDLTKYCEHRRKVMLEHVHEGYADATWEYITDSVQAMMDSQRS
jgi:ariadne-1